MKSSAEGEKIAAEVKAGKAQKLVARPKDVERVMIGEAMHRWKAD